MRCVLSAPPEEHTRARAAALPLVLLVCLMIWLAGYIVGIGIISKQ